MKARLYLMRALAPARRVYFLCSSKENRRKEKTPEDLPAIAGSLRFSQKPALAQLATLKQAQASSGFHCDARLRLRGDKTVICPYLLDKCPSSTSKTFAQIKKATRRSPFTKLQSIKPFSFAWLFQPVPAGRSQTARLQPVQVQQQHH